MTDWDDLKEKYGERKPVVLKPAEDRHDVRRLVAAILTIVVVGVVYVFLSGLVPIGNEILESSASLQGGTLGDGSMELGSVPDSGPVTEVGDQGPDAAVEQPVEPAPSASAQNGTAQNETPQLPGYVSPCGSSISLVQVADDRITLSSSGPDQVTDVSVRDLLGNTVGTVALSQGSPATVYWARGPATGVIASGTCNGVSVSAICQDSDSCWNSTSVPQQCVSQCLAGWVYDQPSNSCSEDSCVDSCGGFDNATVFENYSDCAALVHPEDVEECSNLLGLPSVTEDTVSIVNSGSLDATDIVVQDDSQNTFGSPFTVPAGSNQSAGWTRGSSAAAYVFWSCGGAQYGVFCPEGEACWQ